MSNSGNDSFDLSHAIPGPFGTHPPEAYLIDANQGVDIARRGDLFIATPRYLEAPDERHEPFPLPPLMGQQFDRLTKLLRTAWRLTGTCVSWMLYIHLTEHRWYPYLPPQWCARDGSLANLSFPRVDVPGRELRLCGTYRSDPTTDVALLSAMLPPRDGLHLIWHPGNWAAISAFINVGGTSVPVAVDACIADELEPSQEDLQQRLWIATEV